MNKKLLFATPLVALTPLIAVSCNVSSQEPIIDENAPGYGSIFNMENTIGTEKTLFEKVGNYVLTVYKEQYEQWLNTQLESIKEWVDLSHKEKLKTHLLERALESYYIDTITQVITNFKLKPDNFIGTFHFLGATFRVYAIHVNYEPAATKDNTTIDGTQYNWERLNPKINLNYFLRKEQK